MNYDKDLLDDDDLLNASKNFYGNTIYLENGWWNEMDDYDEYDDNNGDWID